MAALSSCYSTTSVGSRRSSINTSSLVDTSPSSTRGLSLRAPPAAALPPEDLPHVTVSPLPIDWCGFFFCSLHGYIVRSAPNSSDEQTLVVRTRAEFDDLHTELRRCWALSPLPPRECCLWEGGRREKAVQLEAFLHEALSKQRGEECAMPVDSMLGSFLGLDYNEHTTPVLRRVRRRWRDAMGIEQPLNPSSSSVDVEEGGGERYEPKSLLDSFVHSRHAYSRKSMELPPAMEGVGRRDGERRMEGGGGGAQGAQTSSISPRMVEGGGVLPRVVGGNGVGKVNQTPPPPPPPHPPSSSGLLLLPQMDLGLSEGQLSRLSNKNRPREFAWLAPLLGSIVEGSGRVVFDQTTREEGVAAFVVGGACPNAFCGMQAVLYTVMERGLDFWWIKPERPSPSTPSKLDERTLHKNIKGPAKNDPGRARALYAQFAQLFGNEQREGGGAGLLSFGVLHSPGERPRAFIERRETGERYYVYFIWQENYSANPLAASKFITGKIVYQQTLSSKVFFARPYAYRDGIFSMPQDAPPESFPSVMPPDSIKLHCDEK